MKLAQYLVINEWIAVWRLLLQNKLYVVAAGVLDALFFFAYGIVTSPVYDKLTEHVIIIGSLVSEQLRVAAGRARPAVMDTLFHEPVRQYTMQMLGLLLVLALAVFVLYTITHGLNWWLAASLAGKKSEWLPYLQQFARVNALWFGLFVAWYVLDTILDLRRIVVEKATGQPVGGDWFLVVLLVVLAYFAVVSYPLLHIRKAFSTGAKKASVLVLAFALAAVQLLAANRVLQWVALLNKTVMFLVGVVLLLVLFAWSRLYLARVVRRVSAHV